MNYVVFDNLKKIVDIENEVGKDIGTGLEYKRMQSIAK